MTCELGGGMATAYHRRPLLASDDIAALANAKLGNGSAWQGYYMYVGGLNPVVDMQESQVTGYPNDLPVIDYDFHAPVGAAGQIGRTHALLRQQHAFLESFGGWLAPLPSTLPEELPSGLDDLDTVRWAVRADESSGVVFINRQQPYGDMQASDPVSFQVELRDGVVRFPDEPVTIPAGTIARLPIGVAVGELHLEWSTANLLTVLPRTDQGSVLVLIENRDMPAKVALAGQGVLDVDSASPWIHVQGDDAILLLPADLAEQAWVIDGRLYLSHDELDVDADGVLTWHRHGGDVAQFDTTELTFRRLVTQSEAPSEAALLPLRETRQAAPPPVEYGRHEGRASAPSIEQIQEAGAQYVATIPSELHGLDLEIEIEWVGDVALATHNDMILSDRFWDGTTWVLAIPAGIEELTFHVVPLHPEAPVWLHPTARAKLGATAEQGISQVRASEVRSIHHGGEA